MIISLELFTLGSRLRNNGWFNRKHMMSTFMHLSGIGMIMEHITYLFIGLGMKLIYTQNRFYLLSCLYLLGTLDKRLKGHINMLLLRSPDARHEPDPKLPIQHGTSNPQLAHAIHLLA